MSYNIPLIDFSKCGLLVAEDRITEDNLRHSGDELYAALSTAGFAYLTNHGIDWNAVDDLNDAAERFYSLPLEIKKQSEKQSILFSYDSVENSKVNLKDVDFYEGFRASGEAFADETYCWPNVPGFKEHYFKFADIAGKLLIRLMKALGYGMKLKDANYFCKAHSLLNQKGNMAQVKTIKYPPIIDDDVATENRLGEHTDKGSMTLLFQDDVGGLQVRNSSGKLVDVEPIQGAIILNIGDILEAWSGNKLKATSHKVSTPSDPSKRGKVRRSIVYFGVADSHVLMKKLEFEDGVQQNQKEGDAEPMTVEEYALRTVAPMFSY